MNRITDKIKNAFFADGHERSKNAKKQINISFGLRILSIISSFILVPMTLNYLGGDDSSLGNLKYGIWLTLSSIVGYMGFFDIGIGNGLRNKFAEALAKNDHLRAKVYVSTAYVLFTLIFSVLFIIFLFVNPYIDWVHILRAPESMRHEINSLVYFVVFFLFGKFVIGLISVILKADQRPSISNSVYPLGNILTLIFVFILSKLGEGSLFWVGIAMSSTPFLILVAFTVYFYSKDYKIYYPRLKYFQPKHSKTLVNVGIQFFIIQICIVVILYTDNIIITRLPDLGPAMVTPYNIAQKYFNMVLVVFTIIMSPFWSAYTEAYVKKEFSWIKRTNRDLVKIWGLTIIVVLAMIFGSSWFYKLWVGDKVTIPLSLTIFVGLYVIITTWNNIHTFFINGTGKIRLQTFVYVFGAVINIPVSVFLAKYMNMGLAGVILGTCFSLLPSAILMPLQYLKIVNQKEKGLWSR